jgi:hypothetical protein
MENEEKELAKLLLNHCGQYNNHKENMAYAGVLLQVGIFAYVMTAHQWPPSSLNHAYVPCATAGFIFVIWVLIHIFIGWQLRNRKLAARRTAATARYLFGDNKSPQDNEKSKPNNKAEPLVLIFFWLKDSGYEGDVKIKKSMNLCQHLPTQTSVEELILFIGSLIMLFSILMRTIRHC